jgi:hypothetical protein
MRAGPIPARLQCSSSRAGKNQGLAATKWELGPARSAPIFELLPGAKIYLATWRKKSKLKEQRTLILAKEVELVSQAQFYRGNKGCKASQLRPQPGVDFIRVQILLPWLHNLHPNPSISLKCNWERGDIVSTFLRSQHRYLLAMRHRQSVAKAAQFISNPGLTLGEARNSQIISVE